MAKSTEKKLIEIVCPNCGGSTSVENEGRFPIYTCHIGHVFSEKAFAATYATYMEGLLWEAYRAVVENMHFHLMCQNRAEKVNDPEMSDTCRTQAERLEGHAKTLRKLIDDIIYDAAEHQNQKNLP